MRAETLIASPCWSCVLQWMPTWPQRLSCCRLLLAAQVSIGALCTVCGTLHAPSHPPAQAELVDDNDVACLKAASSAPLRSGKPRLLSRKPWAPSHTLTRTGLRCWRQHRPDTRMQEDQEGPKDRRPADGDTVRQCPGKGVNCREGGSCKGHSVCQGAGRCRYVSAARPLS